MSDAALWISTGAAVVSVGAAIWATCKAGKAHKDSLAVQTKLGQIEEARESDRQAEKTKARIRPAIRKEQIRRRVWSYRMDIRNSGLAGARNVKLTVDDKHRFAAKITSLIDRIEPDAVHSIVLNKGYRPTVEPLRMEISWEDDSGQPGRFETTLSF